MSEQQEQKDQINIQQRNGLKIQPKDFIIKNNHHLQEVYKIDQAKALGEGGHASIFKVQEIDQSDQSQQSQEQQQIQQNKQIQKCVKKFEKKNIFFKNSEIQSLKSLDHPNIVKIYEYFDERDAFYVVMEEVKGRDLFDEITFRGKPFSEKDACEIISQVLQALVYTHSKGFIHRDIKLDNIMINSNIIKGKKDKNNIEQKDENNKQNNTNINEQQQNNNPNLQQLQQQTKDTNEIIKDKEIQQNEQQQENTQPLYNNDKTDNKNINNEQDEQEEIQWNVKLIDWSFGLDTNIKKNKFYNTMCGSLIYQAPEYFEKKYNEKIDIWALGVVLYTILSNKYPFTGKNKIETQQAIQKNRITFGDEWQNISDEAKDVILKMLEKDQEKRPSAQQILNHIWFKTQKSKHAIMQDKEIIKNNLRNLKQFKCDNEFQKAILTFISVYLVSNQDKIELQKLFKMLDTNSDGKLSKEEILNGYNKIWGDDYINNEQIQEIFQQVDSDQSDSIDYSEFITASLHRSIYNQKQYLQAAFNLFDTDRDGYITKDEILRILGHSEDSYNDDNKNINDIHDYIDSIISSVDSIIQDGKISFDEFSNMIQSFTNTEIQMSQ